MRTIYGYQALDTCAADGMCAEKCPVNINTGRMVKDLRARALPPDSLGHRAGVIFGRQDENDPQPVHKAWTIDVARAAAAIAAFA